jgi:hypothetical protein
VVSASAPAPVPLVAHRKHRHRPRSKNHRSQPPSFLKFCKIKFDERSTCTEHIFFLLGEGGMFVFIIFC